MITALSYLISLRSIAKKNNHRYLVRLTGDEAWSFDLLAQFLSSIESPRCAKLGGQAIQGTELFQYKQGSQLLGTELDHLIYDDANGFDANSFTAASGAIRGGGLLFLLLSDQQTNSYKWLTQHLSSQIVLKQDADLPALPYCSNNDIESKEFAEQLSAVKMIKKVHDGHRKRPLVLTADRGRGKSSALGMAAARLINEKATKIVITAPSRKAVDPVFAHAIKNVSSKITHQHKNRIEIGDSYIHYIAPDELLSARVDADIVFIDEAAAIPISMLISILSTYHRTVFSSTIHGYEGCGRGFTLKFFHWLSKHRPGWKHLHINQPIRWRAGDPLENWIMSTFLLNAESRVHTNTKLEPEPALSSVSKEQLLALPSLLNQCFALLVNAHYQTTPNDLIQILDDDSITLYTFMQKDTLIGCMVTTEEGSLSESVINDVMVGTRRPKGHLAPVILAGQFGIFDAARTHSLRIMRIAVSPEWQGQGMGTKMVDCLCRDHAQAFDYISTSYGVTEELLKFWRGCGFHPIRLGSSVDHVSGTHSLLMLNSATNLTWLSERKKQFSQDVVCLLPETFSDLSPQLVIDLLMVSQQTPQTVSCAERALIKQYATGGSSYESVVYALTQWLLNQIEHKEVHPILVSKLLQRKSWSDVAKLYSLTGRKKAEMLFRESIRKMSEFTL